MARRIVAHFLAGNRRNDGIAPAGAHAQLTDDGEEVHGREGEVPADGGPERVGGGGVVEDRAQRAAQHGQRAQPHHLLDRVGGGEDEVGGVTEQVG
jgi:hypothetical protein